jgi:hypothetical protein
MTSRAVFQVDSELFLKALIGSRVHYYDSIMYRDTTQLVFKTGWHRRAVSV